MNSHEIVTGTTHNMLTRPIASLVGARSSHRETPSSRETADADNRRSSRDRSEQRKDFTRRRFFAPLLI